jgi:hypothetical protein
MTTKRFHDGTRQKQCEICRAHGARSTKPKTSLQL